MSRTTLRVTLALAAFALAPLGDAKAITLTVNSVEKLVGNTGDTANGSNSNSYHSLVNIVNAGAGAGNTIGAAVAGTARYAYVQTSDADGVFPGAANLTGTANYRATFTVGGTFVGMFYDLKIDTARIGALVTRDESGATAAATINAVTGKINGVTNAGLGLPGGLSRSSSSTGFLNVNQANTLTLLGLSGDQVIQLDFTWTTNTSSNNGILAGDEGVALFGDNAQNNTRVAQADDYGAGGTSGRLNPAADGHFVTVTATITAVPEPSTWLLLGLGLMATPFVARRRRKA